MAGTELDTAAATLNTFIRAKPAWKAASWHIQATCSLLPLHSPNIYCLSKPLQLKGTSDGEELHTWVCGRFKELLFNKDLFISPLSLFFPSLQKLGKDSKAQ